MLRSGSFDLVKRNIDKQNDKTPRLKGSVGAELHSLAQDRAIRTDPEETRRRRTIRLAKQGRTWGFTLQTYGIRNKKSREIEVMSYVDYVEIQSPAWVAGMRRGDIILSVNGESVENSTHAELVKRIQRGGAQLRLVVLFEDCCRKVELHERFIKLKKLLYLKTRELRHLEDEEKAITQRVPLSRSETVRHSTTSSTSSDWDIYSELTSPVALDNLPANQFVFRDNHINQPDLSAAVAGLNPDPDPDPGHDLECAPEDGDASRDSKISSDDIVRTSVHNNNPSPTTQTTTNGAVTTSQPLSIRTENNTTSSLNQRSSENTDCIIAAEEDSSENNGKQESIQNLSEATSSPVSSFSSIISQGSDSALKHLYNITRGAQRMSDISKVSHEPDAAAAEEPVCFDPGSLTNLVESAGKELHKVGVVGQETKRSRPGRGMNVFYIESDSEESINSSGELERNKDARLSFGSVTTTGSAVSSVSAGSSGSHGSVSVSDIGSNCLSDIGGSRIVSDSTSYSVSDSDNHNNIIISDSCGYNDSDCGSQNINDNGSYDVSDSGGSDNNDVIMQVPNRLPKDSEQPTTTSTYYDFDPETSSISNRLAPIKENAYVTKREAYFSEADSDSKGIAWDGKKATLKCNDEPSDLSTPENGQFSDSDTVPGNESRKENNQRSFHTSKLSTMQSLRFQFGILVNDENAVTKL